MCSELMRRMWPVCVEVAEKDQAVKGGEVGALSGADQINVKPCSLQAG